jgi:hypothetical protein
LYCYGIPGNIGVAFRGKQKAVEELCQQYHAIPQGDHPDSPGSSE